MERREFITLFIGVAAVWPLAARAQQPAMPVVGFMSGRSPEDSAHVAAAFRQGLADSDFIEGQTVKIEYRWANGDSDKLPALAADLVNHKVAVFVAVGGDVSAAVAAKATKTIPVVFGVGSDPVKAGLVASFRRPGGNVTGYTLWTTEAESKRLGLLRALVPGVPLIGILVNPRFPPTEQELLELEPAAKAVNQFREYAVAGGLISYGPNVAESYKNAGTYVGRILKGEKPADLPVLQPTKFDFVINLKTAKALGLTVPPTLLIEAGEVIE